MERRDAKARRDHRIRRRGGPGLGAPRTRGLDKILPGGGTSGRPERDRRRRRPGADGPGDERDALFAAAPERVFTVARSTLLSLGWKVDKEDRRRGLAPHEVARRQRRGLRRLRQGDEAPAPRRCVKGRDGRSEVTVERRVWKEERILCVDKEEDIATSDRTVERRVLDAIAKGL